MRKLRVVQYGTWCMCHSDHVMMTLRTMPHLFDIVGICEPDPARRASAEKRDCYKGLRWLTAEEILADKTIDCVFIESHETTQDVDALPFAKAGFHIHLEKPGGCSSAFEELVDVMEQTGRVLHLGYMYRYNPAVQYALSLVDSGKLGRIQYVEAQMSTCYGKGGMDFLETLPGGMMLYLGCHLTDLIYRIQGQPGRVIPYNHTVSTLNPHALDTGFVLYEYENGISFAKTSAAEVNGDARRQLVISGENGTVEIMPLENPLEAPGIVCPGDVPCKVTYRDCYMGMRNFAVRSQHMNFPLYGRYDAMLLDLVRKICGEPETVYTYAYERALHRLIRESIGVESFSER